MKYLAKKYFLVVFVLTFSFFFLEQVLEIKNKMISMEIAASFAVIVLLRKKKTQTTWILKKSIFLE
jgi:Na+/H+ antiporter NhaD/arsenite permease-like protein